MTIGLDRSADLNRVLLVADEISGARDASMLWLQQPLSEFDGLSPEVLVAKGRADDVIGYLRSIASGFVG